MHFKNLLLIAIAISLFLIGYGLQDHMDSNPLREKAREVERLQEIVSREQETKYGKEISESFNK